MSVSNPRRYYLLKAQAAVVQWDDLANTWWAKQQAQPGTPLAASFPARAALAAAHYTTVEDLQGATAIELTRAGLSLQQANAAIAALE